MQKRRDRIGRIGTKRSKSDICYQAGYGDHQGEKQSRCEFPGGFQMKEQSRNNATNICPTQLNYWISSGVSISNGESSWASHRAHQILTSKQRIISRVISLYANFQTPYGCRRRRHALGGWKRRHIPGLK